MKLTDFQIMKKKTESIREENLEYPLMFASFMMTFKKNCIFDSDI